MAIFSKKLKLKNTAGTTQNANIYSTASEAGSNYMRAVVDGQTAYIALGSISDANRTSGRVKKTNGGTYAILKTSVPPYGYSYLTTNGSFTVPSGVTKLRVTCVGGGAGGCSGLLRGSYEEVPCESPMTVTTGVGGGQTKFGSVVANGGSSPTYKFFRIYHPGSGDPGEGGNLPYWSDYYADVRWSYGYYNGTVSSSDDGVPGGSAVPLANIHGSVIGYAGSGGYADSGHVCIMRAGYTCANINNGGNYDFRVCSGASGYRTISTINVTPGPVIGYSIGRGGYWCDGSNLQSSSWNSGGHGGDLGRSGAILVEWGSGIQ